MKWKAEWPGRADEGRQTKNTNKVISSLIKECHMAPSIPSETHHQGPWTAFFMGLMAFQTWLEIFNATTLKL